MAAVDRTGRGPGLPPELTRGARTTLAQLRSTAKGTLRTVLSRALNGPPEVPVPLAMGPGHDASTRQRLLAAAAVLAPSDGPLPSDALPPSSGAGAKVPVGAPTNSTLVDLLAGLLAGCPARPGPPHWLILTATHGVFPDAAAVRELARALELDAPHEVAAHLLAVGRTGEGSHPGSLRHTNSRGGANPAGALMDIVTDRPVIDVDFCARHDTHTGIQRVVREVMPLWSAGHDTVLVAHTSPSAAYRELIPKERERVLSYGSKATTRPTGPPPRLVVPWRTTVVMPDVVAARSVAGLAALAEFSGNQVALVGYDMIPLISTELRPIEEADVFAHYLRLVKHSHRVAAISSSAAAEFTGFARMLRAQGLPGPVVREVVLAEDVGMPLGVAPEPTPSARPVVLALGRREPHKNLRAVLHAAERLWLDGLDFEVVMLGGAGWDERDLAQATSRLQAAGRPLRQLGWVTDAEMVAQIRSAAFTIFVSLHEGYGLPVSESLACGTPVITSNFGSQQEIATAGGCLVVDPRDDAAITRAMRLLITNPPELARLRAEVTARPARRWPEYAADAWEFLVGPEQHDG